jgi:hypothetical protein
MATGQLAQGQKITTADSGNTLVVGDAGHGNTAGAVVIEFLPDGTWTGNLVVVARVGGGPLSKQEAKLGVPFAQVPYRAAYLNGAVSDYSIQSVPLTGASLVQVPANGTAIGFLVTCTAGFATVYFRTLDGPCAL